MGSRRDFGSVRRLPSGRWQARHRTTGGGPLVAAPGTFVTKGDAAAWLAQAQADQLRGQFIDPRAGQVTLRELAERFLAQRSLAERTAETYRGLLDSHILPALGAHEIGQLTPSAVRSWHADLARLHPSTAAIPAPAGHLQRRSRGRADRSLPLPGRRRRSRARPDPADRHSRRRGGDDRRHARALPGPPPARHVVSSPKGRAVRPPTL